METPKKATFGPLSFELHEISREEFFPGVFLSQYGVKVLREGERTPLMIQFGAPTAMPPEDVAKGVLLDLLYASERPDFLWSRIKEAMDSVSAQTGIRTPPEILAAVRQGFDRMAAWTSERPESVRGAAEAAGLEAIP